MPNNNLPSMGDEKQQLYDFIMRLINQRGILSDEELAAQGEATWRPVGEQYDEAEDRLSNRMLSRGMFDAPFTLDEYTKLDKRREQGFTDMMTNLTTANIEGGQRSQLAGLGALGDMWGTEYGSTSQMNMMRERLKAQEKEWWEQALQGLFQGVGTYAGHKLGSR